MVAPPDLSLTTAHRRLAVAISATASAVPGQLPGSAPLASARHGCASLTVLPFAVSFQGDTVLVRNISHKSLHYVRFMVIGVALWADQIVQVMPGYSNAVVEIPKADSAELLGVRWLDDAGKEFVWSHPLA